jgi:hypothetical protein
MRRLMEPHNAGPVGGSGLRGGYAGPDLRENDPVSHPAHYTRGKIEVLDFIEDQGFSYHAGNVVKYLCRAPYKGNEVQDLRKALTYLQRLIALKQESSTDEAAKLAATEVR